MSRTASAWAAMIPFQSMAIVAVVVLMVGALSACSALAPCNAAACAADAKITVAVKERLGLHDALKVEPVAISVQTIGGVVYLGGVVDTELQRQVAEEVAHEAPGVTRVENRIGVLNNW